MHFFPSISIQIGKHFDGVWHTGVVAFGQEWYFGNDGVASCPPKGTILGEPNEMILLGHTELDESEFLEVITQMSENEFKFEILLSYFLFFSK